MNQLSLHMTPITLVSQYFYPSSAATAQLMDDLVRGLTSRGKRVTVLTGSDGGSYPYSHVVRFSTRSYTNSSSVLYKAFDGTCFFLGALFWLLTKHPPSAKIIILSNPPFAVLLGLLVYLFKRSRYIFVLQDLFPRSAVLSGVLPPRGPITFFWRYLMHLGCKYAATTIVLSKQMLTRAQTEYFNLSNLSIIHNWAVETGKPIPKSQNKLARRWQIETNFTVQYSGNFGRLHDLITLLEAARMLKESSIKFVFIGHGAKRQLIQQYIERYSMGEYCQLHPYMPRTLLPLSLAACDISAVCLTPGSEDTVAPSKVCGILSTGKPILIVSSPGSRIAHAVRTYQAGLTCECGDVSTLVSSLLSLKDNPTLLAAMKENALRMYGDIFSKNNSIESYIQILDD